MNTEFIAQIALILSLLSNAITVFVSLTETPKDNAVWAKIYPWIEKAGLIFGKAKDKA